MWDLKKNRTIVVILILIASVGFYGTKLTIEAREDSNSDSSSGLEGSTLSVITRYDVTIANAFKAAFLASEYAIKNDITDMAFYSASTDQGWRNLLINPTFSIDVAWGAEVNTFTAMEADGLLKHIDNSTLKLIIDSNIPEELAGIPLKINDSSGDYVWIGNSIKTFGFTVNHNFLSSHSLPVPSTWDNLSSPIYYLGPSEKSVAMSDAPLSTTNTRIYHIILQALGWEEGWANLTMIGANAGIYSGAVSTRAAVVSGDVGVGMTIDFYGVIAERENPNCEFIIPENQSIVSPDPVALSKNVDNQAEAEAFIEFLVSPEGQSIWLTVGLDRLPTNEEAFHTSFGQTRTDLYELFNETLASNPINFNETLAQSYHEIVKYYFHETISSEHTKLRNTWGEMVYQLFDGKISVSTYNAYVDDLGETYYTKQEAIDANIIYNSDPGLAVALEADWRAFAENKYDLIYDSLVPTIPEINPKIQLIYLNVVVILLVSLIRKKRKRNY